METQESISRHEIGGLSDCAILLFMLGLVMYGFFFMGGILIGVEKASQGRCSTEITRPVDIIFPAPLVGCWLGTPFEETKKLGGEG